MKYNKITNKETALKLSSGTYLHDRLVGFNYRQLVTSFGTQHKIHQVVMERFRKNWYLSVNLTMKSLHYTIGKRMTLTIL